MGLGHFIVNKVNIKNYMLFIKAAAQPSSQNRVEGVRLRRRMDTSYVQRTFHVSSFHI